MKERVLLSTGLQKAESFVPDITVVLVLKENSVGTGVPIGRENIPFFGIGGRNGLYGVVTEDGEVSTEVLKP